MTKDEPNLLADMLMLSTIDQYDPNAFLTPATDLGLTVSQLDETQAYVRDMQALVGKQVEALQASLAERAEKTAEGYSEVLPQIGTGLFTGDLQAYLTESFHRWVIFVDTLRRRGNQFIQHEQQGCPPVLAYDYETIIDGATLARPVNYSLVRIKPPKGVKTRENGRPYIIIDPRAGHGSGIGGFKSESEVGVALASGHPTYFCIFSTHPVPTQTLADVCRAEAQFVREVRRRHPDSPKPVVIGNCQGGWAAMLLAATSPDLTGPVVVNGSPLSYWSGARGKNPMRYSGGLLGGSTLALMAADLGNGQFDGAHLVENFENLNPANTFWKKYYDVYAKAEAESDHYLEFERWWSGFYFMNESEIRWILENLFVGNRLAHGTANLDSRLHVDFRNIRAPIIVFASHGDNITPPAQALNWIRDIYSSVQEIKTRGQRIVYTVHDSIGHLGIFVSSSIANKQHKEISSTLKTIEALAPGLYEMEIVDVVGDGIDRTYKVEFHERSIEDLEKLGDSARDERPFAAVARVSEINSEFYKLAVRPLIRSLVSPFTAKMLVDNHPLRQRRYFFSDRNPLVTAITPLAEAMRGKPSTIAPDNVFLKLEQAFSGAVTAFWDNYRDIRDSMAELTCTALYSAPWMQALVPADAKRISETPSSDLRAVPDVISALEDIAVGGFAEAVIRMLIMLAHSRTSVRRDRLERSNHVLTMTDPFAGLGMQGRNRIIHRQSLIVDFEPELAMETLPKLLPDAKDRRSALEVCQFIVGPTDEMDERTTALFQRLRQALQLDAPPAAAKASRSKASDAVH